MARESCPQGGRRHEEHKLKNEEMPAAKIQPEMPAGNTTGWSTLKQTSRTRTASDSTWHRRIARSERQRSQLHKAPNHYEHKHCAALLADPGVDNAKNSSQHTHTHTHTYAHSIPSSPVRVHRTLELAMQRTLPHFGVDLAVT